MLAHDEAGALQATQHRAGAVVPVVHGRPPGLAGEVEPRRGSTGCISHHWLSVNRARGAHHHGEEMTTSCSPRRQRYPPNRPSRGYFLSSIWTFDEVVQGSGQEARHSLALHLKPQPGTALPVGADPVVGNKGDHG